MTYPYGPPPVPTRPATLAEPLYDASIGQSVDRFWRKYATFSGRASRSEFWWWFLVSYVVGLVLAGLQLATFGGDIATYTVQSLFEPNLANLLSWGWSLATLVPTLAVGVRRLHDINWSGWWQLLAVPAYLSTFLTPWLLPTPDQLTADPAGVVPQFVVLLLVSQVVFAGSLTLIVLHALQPDSRGVRFDG